MLYQYIIMFQIIGAAFMLLGLIPFKSDDTKNAYLNKVVCFTLAAIIFFSLGATAVKSEFNTCYTNQSITIGDITDYTQNCETNVVLDTGISGLNVGLGWVSLLLGLVSTLLAAFTRNDSKFIEE